MYSPHTQHNAKEKYVADPEKICRRRYREACDGNTKIEKLLEILRSHACLQTVFKVTAKIQNKTLSLLGEVHMR